MILFQHDYSTFDRLPTTGFQAFKEFVGKKHERGEIKYVIAYKRLTMLTLFLVFIITKGALTLYEGNTIGSGAARGGGTAQFVIGNLSMHPVIKLVIIEIIMTTNLLALVLAIKNTQNFFDFFRKLLVLFALISMLIFLIKLFILLRGLLPLFSSSSS